jgi:hypothetical protein
MAIHVGKHPGRGGAKLAVAGLLFVGQAVGAATYRPSMTGKELVRDMMADPAVTLNAVKRERAIGYLDGIMDATVGSRWCPDRKAVPHELNYLVTEALSNLSAKELDGNAMPLVTAALGKRFPCAAESKS